MPSGLACQQTFKVGLCQAEYIGQSTIACQLAATPMMVFPVSIEHALDVTVQCPRHADAREHRITAALGDQQQRLHRRLPFFGIMLRARHRAA